MLTAGLASIHDSREDIQNYIIYATYDIALSAYHNVCLSLHKVTAALQCRSGTARVMQGSCTYVCTIMMLACTDAWPAAWPK